ncbi:MAG: transporter substrate-binding domain-containing protein [Syntrophobacteraceae bacterium]
MQARLGKHPVLARYLIWIISIGLLLAGLFLIVRPENERKAPLATAHERDWLAAHPVITIAPDPDYPPIEYFDENGKYRGIAADYVALIEKKLGFQFKIAHLQSWDEILDKAKSRQVDMFGAAAETPQRSEYMLFTRPFVEFPSVIIVRKNVSESLSIQKLDGMKVAIVSGYADHDYIKNNYPKLQLDVVPTVATGLRKVSFGMVDALIANLASATYYIEKEGITNLRLAGNTGYTYRLGFGVRKDWPELINILEKGLAQIEPGEKEAVFKKWVQLGHVSVFAHREFWITVLGGLSVAVFAILGLFVWNWSLKSVVSLRTQELRNELAERKRAEEALRTSETKYRVVSDNTYDWEYWVSPQGRFLYTSPACQRITGYSASELESDPGLFFRIVHPDDLSQYERYFAPAQLDSGPCELEFRIIHRDGAPRWIGHVSQPVYDGEGAFLGRRGSNRDVTKRKGAEEALHESQQMLHSILDTIPVRVFWKDLDLNYLGCNRPFALDAGLQSPGEIVGRSDFEMGWGEQAELYRSDDRQVIETGKAKLGYEEPQTTPSGDKIWLLTSKIPLLDVQGEIKGVLGTYEDITVRKRAEEALRLFAYSVAHDLKSPAIGIYGLTKRLHRQYMDVLDEKGRNYCEQILKVSEHIALLAEKINVYIVTKESPPSFERIDIKEILKMLKDEFSAQLNIRRIEWLEPEDEVEIIGDRLSILRAFRNLVDNALKYGGERLSKIWVGHEETENTHIFSITDNGKGLKGQDAEKIFGLFQRHETSRGVEGAGLGLAIVKEIAQQHGGQVWVESAVKKGTSFCISISKNL